MLISKHNWVCKLRRVDHEIGRQINEEPVAKPDKLHPRTRSSLRTQLLLQREPTLSSGHQVSQIGSVTSIRLVFFMLV